MHFEGNFHVLGSIMRMPLVTPVVLNSKFVHFSGNYILCSQLFSCILVNLTVSVAFLCISGFGSLL